MYQEHSEHLHLESTDQHVKSYCPRLLVKRLAESGEKRLSVSCTSGIGACLVLDICGFTRLTKELSSEGHRGLIKLHYVISTFLRECVNIIHEFGGDGKKRSNDSHHNNILF